MFIPLWFYLLRVTSQVRGAFLPNVGQVPFTMKSWGTTKSVARPNGRRMDFPSCTASVRTAPSCTAPSRNSWQRLDITKERKKGNYQSDGRNVRLIFLIFSGDLISPQVSYSPLASLIENMKPLTGQIVSSKTRKIELYFPAVQSIVDIPKFLDDVFTSRRKYSGTISQEIMVFF